MTNTSLIKAVIPFIGGMMLMHTLNQGAIARIAGLTSSSGGVVVQEKNHGTTMQISEPAREQEQEEQGHEHEQDSSVEGEDSYYSWIGDLWIPPNGRPTYSAADFLKYFQKRNVLFIGDSTLRRSYVMLYGTMTANNLADVYSKEVDPDVKDILDVNKRAVTENCTLSDRAFYNGDFASKLLTNPNRSFPLCRNLPSAPTTTREHSSHAAPTKKTPKFDFLTGWCLRDIQSIFSPDFNDLSAKPGYIIPSALEHLGDYDLVVIGVGVHDASRRPYCGTMSVKDDIKQLNTTLQVLKNASSPKLQIVFRTAGYIDEKDGKFEGLDTLSALLNRTKVFFKELKKNPDGDGGSSSGSSMSNNQPTSLHPNMTLVDWGSNIIKRSFLQNRIKGDMRGHYGLQGKLLFTQMLLHELLAAEENQSGRSSKI